MVTSMERRVCPRYDLGEEIVPGLWPSDRPPYEMA